MARKILFILFVFLIVSCKQNKPKDVLDKTRFKAVMKDLILAQSIKNMSFGKDSLDFNPIELVYKTYHIDSIILKKSTDYYSKKPEIFKEIYSELKTEFKHKQDSIDSIIGKAKKPSKKTIKSDKIKVLKKNINIDKLIHH